MIYYHFNLKPRMKHKKQKKPLSDEILSSAAVQFHGREFLKVIFNRKKDAERWFCNDDSLPENLNTANGHGYKSLSSFYKALTYRKHMCSENSQWWRERNMQVGWKD